MLNIRIGDELERDLEEIARAVGVTKTEFVRLQIAGAVERAKLQPAPTPWELGEDLFGKVCSGKRNLSRQRARDLIAKGRRATAAR